MPLIGLDPSSAEAGLGPTWSATGLQTESMIQKQAEADLVTNPRPSFGDTLGAAFTTENAIYNSMQRGLVSIKNMFPRTDDTALTPDEIYDQIRGTTYEPYYSELVGSKTQNILEGYKGIVDDRIKSVDTLNRSGVASSLTAGLIAGTLDIGTLMPGGTVYKSYKTGASILKSAASVGAAGAAASSLTEAYLLDKQADRTFEQSVENVIADAILSGAIGGGVAGVTSAIRKQGTREIADILSDLDPVIKMNEDGTVDIIKAQPAARQSETPVDMGTVNAEGLRVKYDGTSFTPEEIEVINKRLRGDTEVGPGLSSEGTLSAAVTVKPDIDPRNRVKLKAIEEDEITFEGEGLYALPKKVQDYLVLSPITRGLTSPFTTMRKHTNDVFQHDFIANKNQAGEANQPALESQIAISKIPLYKAHIETEKAYANYIGIKPGTLQGTRAKLQRGDKLTREEFGDRVARAMRRADEDEIPEVAAVAKNYRAMMQPYIDELVTLGVFPENVEVHTAASYLSRLWNRNKLIAEPEGFRRIATKWITEQNEELTLLQPQIKSLEASISESGKRLKELENTPPAQLIKRAIEDKETIGVGRLINVSENKIASIEKSIRNDEIRIRKNNKRQLTLGNKDLSPANIEAINKIKQETLDLEASIKDKQAKLKSQTDESMRLVDIYINDANKLFKQINETSADQLKQLVPRRLRHADGRIRTPVKPSLIPLEVDKIYDNLVDHSNEKLLNPMASSVLGNKGVDTMKQRPFLIPDELIEDYLDNNVNRIMDAYVSGVAPEISIEKYFRGQGFDSANEGIKANKLSVIAEYNEAVTKTSSIKDKTERQKARQKLNRQLNSSLEAIDNNFLLLRGMYGIPKTEKARKATVVGKVTRTYNMMRLMGNMAVAAVADLGMPTIRHGWKAHVQDGIMPILRSMKTAKLSKAEWSDIGVGLETQSGRRYMELFSGPEAYYSQSKLEMGINKASNGFGNIVLANQWNDMVMGVSSQMSSARIIRTVKGFVEKGKIKQVDKEHLGRIRIPEAMYNRIYQQFKQYGDEVKGSFIMNHNDWDDLEAREVVKAAMLTDMDSTVISPGLGDKPYFANTEVGKLLFQFKSFGFAATNKILLSGLQRRDAYVLQGIISMMGFGAMSYYATSFFAGREPADNPAEVFSEAFDRSGLAGLAFEPFLVADKFFGLSEEGLSRYRSRGPLGALLGPTADLIQDVSMISGKSVRSIAGDGDFNHNDLRRIKKLIVYQNLFYIRRLLEKGTDKIGQSLDLEGAPR